MPLLRSFFYEFEVAISIKHVAPNWRNLGQAICNSVENSEEPNLTIRKNF